MMSSLPEIRPFQKSDEAQVKHLILSIQRDEFGLPLTLDDQPDLNQIPDFYQTGNGNFWVAFDQKVVGTLALCGFGHNQVALRKFFVHPDYRGREIGVAQKLLEAALAWSKKKKVQEIFLGTVEAFRAAHRFYEKNGFERIECSSLPRTFPRMAVDTRFYKKTLSCTLYCIHGFLGKSGDWDGVLPDQVAVSHFDLFSPLELSRPRLEFGALSDWIRSTATSQPGKKVLMGYSLGGRIALNTLVGDESPWAAAIIISAHPGLSAREERQKRVKADEEWAIRFEKEEWSRLLADWNSQPVLTGSYCQSRREEDFSRRALAEVLRNCSLGVQDDLRGFLKNLQLPILWVVGENDLKFLSIAEEVKLLNDHISLAIIPESGHRVPWDQTDSFKKQLLGFLERLQLT